ncbi:MAG TPA: gliding motility-associated C-terminal domain-containing protein [Saprospiraceae bacterium]|nr:gliding motility-associated C-terminal domain-containing protein [Saprospiraceae bacterium]
MLLTRSGYTNDWDGVDKQGNPLPEGGYFWALEYINQNGNLEVAKGSITIVR